MKVFNLQSCQLEGWIANLQLKCKINYRINHLMVRINIS